jgi:hypothetical protein
MSFGGYGRSPEQVQRDNGQRYDFKKIAERYETTVPLRGKRKAENIRPHGDRSRCWERIIKVSDQEYYLTNNAYRWHEQHNYSACRAITFKRDDDGNETVIVHTPKPYWGDEEYRKKLMPKQLGVPSTFFFYNCNLPDEMGMYKYHSKNYLRVRVEEGYDQSCWRFYTVDKGDVVFTRGAFEKFFRPLVVHREFHRSLDRSKTKAIRQELSSFVEYMRVMMPLVEANRLHMHSTPTFWANQKSAEGMYISGEIAQECLGKGWRGLFGGEPNELSFKLVQYYKHRCQRSRWNPETRAYEVIEVTPQTIATYIANEVYRYEKPFHEEPVELGKLTNDKYKTW